MTIPMPAQPRIYHIVHEDRLPSIIADGGLYCDAAMLARASASGTTIGISKIKQRRLKELTLNSHPGLHVGDCVPFYFCPRSIMLYVLHMGNHHDLNYRGGQGPIIHLEADLHDTVAWAKQQNLRWAFSLSNAGAYYFEDRADLRHLSELDWAAIGATDWQNHQEGKQAEFLVESQFPWALVMRIGVQSIATRTKVLDALRSATHQPSVQQIPAWYY